MLRIMINEAPFEQKWTLQGRLAGQWAENLREKWADTRNSRLGRNCLVDLDRASEAEEAFKQALTYAPGYSEASLGLAAIYKSEGKRDEAVRAYKSYLAQNPSGPDAEMARRNLKDLSE